MEAGKPRATVARKCPRCCSRAHPQPHRTQRSAWHKRQHSRDRPYLYLESRAPLRRQSVIQGTDLHPHLRRFVPSGDRARYPPWGRKTNSLRTRSLPSRRPPLLVLTRSFFEKRSSPAVKFPDQIIPRRKNGGKETEKSK